MGLVVLALIAATSVGAAVESTTEGPTRIEVLGYDSAAQRVWVLETQRWNGDAFGDVCFFDLGGEKPTLLHRVDWNRPGEGDRRDGSLQARLGELRARLQPLSKLQGKRNPVKTAIVQREVVHSTAYNVPREHVRVAFEAGPQFELVTYGSPEVGRPAFYGIPGRGEKLFVLAYHDDPEDRESVSHVPVLVLKDESGVRKVDVGKAAWKD
jgi:hypothetical protein